MNALWKKTKTKNIWFCIWKSWVIVNTWLWKERRESDLASALRVSPSGSGWSLCLHQDGYHHDNILPSTMPNIVCVINNSRMNRLGYGIFRKGKIDRKTKYLSIRLSREGLRKSGIFQSFIYFESTSIFLFQLKLSQKSCHQLWTLTFGRRRFHAPKR